MKNLPVGLYRVPGFEEKFAVDVHGNVFGISGNYARPLKTRKRGGTSALNNGRNYQYVDYRGRDGKVKHVYVHTLMALTFLGPRPAGGRKKKPDWEIDHVDGDKDNNSAANLRYVRREVNNPWDSTTGEEETEETEDETQEEVPF